MLGNATVDPSELVFDFSFPEEAGRTNPHLWTDPILALTYAELVAERLSELDPATPTTSRRTWRRSEHASKPSTRRSSRR